MTWVSPMYAKLYSDDPSINPLGRPITREEDTWIGSIINIGSMVGGIPFGFLSSHCGRKITLLTIAVPYFISFVTLAFATDVNLYYFARLLAGIAIGGGYTLLPTYVTEITEDSTRGLMTSLLNCFWTFGNLIPYLIGPFMSALWFNVTLACLPVMFFISFMFIAPESPYYLIGRNEVDKAEQALITLRSGNKSTVQKELEHIKNVVENETHGSLSEIVKSRVLRKAMCIAMLIVIFQQVSGIKAIMFYLQFIFAATGSSIPPEYSSMIFGVVLFGSSFIAPCLADKYGRKVLLTVSSLGATVALGVLGGFFYILNETDIDTSSFSWLPILCLICFVIFFNLGHGSVSWTVTAELFPSNVRSYSATIVSSTTWLTGFFVTKYFSALRDAVQDQGTFWFFSACCLVATLFFVFVLPETKEKSFDEIQKMLENKKSKGDSKDANDNV